MGVPLRVRHALVLLAWTLVGALLIGAALLTRFPDAPIVDRATAWPVVGPLAHAFRDVYRPAPAPPARSGVDDDAPRRSRAVDAPDTADASGVDESVFDLALPEVWVTPDMPLRAAPDDDAEVLHVFDRFANLRSVEQRGDWQRVRRRRGPVASREGWVRAPTTRAAAAASIDAPVLGR
ncbi:MAG: hypothetical protein AAF772_11525, partial [Acidobacteriota bacterium]